MWPPAPDGEPRKVAPVSALAVLSPKNPTKTKEEALEACVEQHSEPSDPHELLQILQIKS